MDECDVLPSVTALGAYGLRVEGIPGAARWMVPQDAQAPEVTIDVHAAAVDRSPAHVDDARADIALNDGGRLRATRASTVVELALPVVHPDPDLLHPYLAPVAALRWQWHGGEALHAGAFATAAGAVIVLGGKEAGKSTLLARLAADGVPVLADDLVIVAGGHVLAGPRSLDLRPSAPDGPWRSGAVEVRGGERLRVELAAAPPRLPPVGVVCLGWGPETDVRPLSGAEVLRLLARSRTFPIGGSAATLLALSGTQALMVSRPRDAAQPADTAARVLDAFA